MTMQQQCRMFTALVVAVVGVGSITRPALSVPVLTDFSGDFTNTEPVVYIAGFTPFPVLSTESTVGVTPVAGPHLADIVFLTDTTGSMISELALLQDALLPGGTTGGGGVIADAEAANLAVDFRWGVADYRDFVGAFSYGPPPDGISVGDDLSPSGTDVADANAAIAAWSITDITQGGAFDLAEQQYSALSNLTAGWDTTHAGRARGSTERIIIWTGDGAAHEGIDEIMGDGAPSGVFFDYSATTFSLFNALREEGISVFALNGGGPAAGIDSPGSLGLLQASTLVEATGGELVNSITGLSAIGLHDTILAMIDTGLTDLNNIVVALADGEDLGPWAVTVEKDPLPTVFGPPPTGVPPPPWSPGTMAMEDYLLEAFYLGGLEGDTRTVLFEMRLDGVVVDTVEVTLTTVIPEPTSVLLFAFGTLYLLSNRRKRQR